MINKSIMSLTILLIALNSDAQTTTSSDSIFQDPTARKAYIFEHLTLPDILLENGVPFVDLSLFDGQDHIDVVADASTFGLAYASVFAIPKPSSQQLPDPDVAYANDMTNTSSTDDIPIIALHYTLDRLVPTAIDDNILYIDNEQLKEVTGNTLSPFETITTFVSTPLLARIHNQSPTFIVSDQYYFGNTGKTLQSADIDFGNGSGWQSLSLNQPFTAFFNTPGDKTLRIKYEFADGTSMENRSLISVIFDPNAQNRTLDGNFDLEYTTIDPANGAQVNVFIDYNCPQDGIRKPLIFVEGFNPPELGPDENLLPVNWRSNFFFFNVLDGFNLIDIIDDEGYDMIYIDYQDGGEEITKNAAAVIEAIQWINAEKNDNNSFEPNVLIGSSMGGLVGKWALRSMELQGIDHETELFVAMDAPMRGANVPLGVQYAARDIPNIDVAVFWEIADFAPVVRLGEQLLNRPATRQLLIYQCEVGRVEGAIESPHSNFINSFHAMGDLSNAREIAVTNGSQIQQGQDYLPHTQYVDAQALNSLTLALYGSGAYLDVGIWALPDNPSQPSKIYSGSLFGFILGFIPVTFHHNHVVIQDVSPMDTAPGGAYNFADVNNVYNGFANGVPLILNWALGIDLGQIEQETFCFIPAVSGIDKNEDFELFFDISNNLARVTDGTTHFKNYIGENTPDASGFDNHNHQNVTDRNSQLMRFEMMGDPVSFPSTIVNNYNYGAAQRDGVDFLATDFFRTSTRLAESVSVQNAELSVNRQDRIGYTNQANNPQNLGQQHYNLGIFHSQCETGPYVVSSTTGGTIRVGDFSFDNTANLYVYGGNTLRAINGGEIIVEENSEIHILDGAELLINSNGKLILEKHATVEIHAASELDLDNAEIEIRDGAELIIRENALFRLNSGEIKIMDGGKLTIDYEGVMDYSGGDIFLNGEEAELELGGIVRVIGGKKFFPKNEDLNNPSGFVHIVSVPGFTNWYFEAVGPNNELELRGNGEDNLILKVDDNAEWRPYGGPGYFQFRTKKIRNGRIELGDDARIELFAIDNVMSHLDIIGPNSRGVHIYNHNFFNHCYFTGPGNGITAPMQFASEHLRVSNSDFVANAKIYITGGSFDLYSCYFKDGFMESKSIAFPSIVENSSFEDAQFISNLNGSSIKFENNQFYTDAPSPSSNNMVYNQGGIVELLCNSFANYTVEVDETTLNLTTKTLSGYNEFDGDNGTYISLDRNTSILDLNNGYNTFRPSEGNPQFIFKILCSSNDVTVSAKNNFWEKYDVVSDQFVDGGPDASLFDYIQVVGTGCAINITCNDPYDNVYEACPGGGGNEKFVIDDGVVNRDDVSEISKNNPYHNGMNRSALSDPWLHTTLLDSILLSEAIYLATNVMEFHNDTLGDDFLAANIFYDVLTYEYDTIVTEVEDMLNIAFQNMKTTIEHTFITDSITVQDNASSFHPLVQQYVDVLMHRSADEISDENYIDQFYLEIDKAQLFNVIGKKKMCWQLLNNLDNCPLDSLEQNYLNQWLEGVGQEILDIQAGMQNFQIDSLVSYVDTTLFNEPSPLEADEYFFGAQIMGVDLVTYANCGLITFRDLDESSNRNFLIYPNPTSGVLTLAFEQERDEDMYFTLFNVLGKEVLSVPIRGQQGLYQLDIGNLPTAVYSYTIKDQFKVLESGQVIKE